MRTYVRNALVLLIIGMCLWGFVQGLIWMERLSNGQPKNYNKRELYESYYEDDTDCSQVDTMKTKESPLVRAALK